MAIEYEHAAEWTNWSSTKKASNLSSLTYLLLGNRLISPVLRRAIPIGGDRIPHRAVFS